MIIYINNKHNVKPNSITMYEIIVNIAKYFSYVATIYSIFVATFAPLLVAFIFRNRPFATKHPVLWWVFHCIIECFMIEQALEFFDVITTNSSLLAVAGICFYTVAIYAPMLVAIIFRNRPFATKYPVLWWVTHWIIECSIIEQGLELLEITFSPIWSSIIIILTGIACVVSVVEIIIPAAKGEWLTLPLVLTKSIDGIFVY